MSAVADLLAESFRLHRSAMPAKGQQRDWPKAKTAWIAARQKRLDALALDPKRDDLAWDLQPVGHEAMMAFYADVENRVRAHKANRP